VLPIFDPKDFFSVNHAKKVEVSDDRQIQLSALKEHSRVNDGVKDIFGQLYSQLELDSVITCTKQDKKWNESLQTCVLSRIMNPCSKQKTVRQAAEKLNVNLDLNHVYRMMDHVAAQENNIKESVSRVTQNLLKEKVDVLLFDVTTLYFESTEADELREFGFSKDCKFNQTQVVLALVTTSEGLPITYELFPGNTYEGSTLIEIVKSLKNKHNIDQVVLVADRAMFNTKNLALMDELEVQYVVAAKLRGLKKEVKQRVLNSRLYKPQELKQELHWINTFDIDNRQLIVSYSSSRAKKDRADRQRLIERLLKKVKNGKLKIADLVNNHGSKKFIKTVKDEAQLDNEKIARDSEWDGLHGVITNIKDKSSQEILNRYRQLWKIEEAFRINKHDLQMRPIFHWKPERIRAHIVICYLAFALLSYAKLKLKEAKVEISIETLCEELSKAQSSIVLDKKSKIYFSIPSQITQNQKAIYRAFGLKRNQSPSILQLS
jgi:transposase